MQLRIEEDKSQDHCRESGRSQNLRLSYLKVRYFHDQSNYIIGEKRQVLILHHLRSDFNHYPQGMGDSNEGSPHGGYI